MIKDALNAKEISALLENRFSVEVFDKIDSTNLYMKKNFADFSHGGAVIADFQESGRGRYKRKFYSPAGCGIYMSVLLRLDLPPEASVLITAAAAVAVCEAIEAFSDKRLEIKWVNDILYNSKKLCGILAESAIDPKSGKIERAVVGIGINAYEPDGGFDSEIAQIAGFVFEERQTGLRNRVCAEIISRLQLYSSELSKKSFLNEYKRRSAVLGKSITVLSEGSYSEAVAIDIDDSCRLLVEYPDKTREYLNSGEISVRL